MSFRFQRTTLLVWGCIHIVIVACAAVQYFPWLSEGPYWVWVERYGAWTGATDTHGYFSPNIPDQIIIELTTVDADGEKTVEILGKGSSQTELRIFSMSTLFAKHEFTDLHGQTLAAYALGRHPEAMFVVVSFRYHEIPSMAATRAGATPSEEEFYRAVFLRGVNNAHPVRDKKVVP
jgi:hypothetical protein